jgi:hypothetical protein
LVTTTDDLTLLLLAAPTAMLLASLAAVRQPGSCPRRVERLSFGAAACTMRRAQQPPKGGNGIDAAIVARNRDWA